MTNEEIREFIRESNRIEGITREPTEDEVEETETFLRWKSPMPSDLLFLLAIYQPGAKLRNKVGLDVRVGEHIPPLGGPHILAGLLDILRDVAEEYEPFQIHQRFETLHPFTDGNGRTGRALWLWQMVNQYDGAPLGFLHTWYYQSLQYGT